MRTELLIGKEKLKKLHASSVTVIGLGAVGGYAVEALVRSGLGRLRLVDFDTIIPTNVNRQLYALTSTLGRRKVDVARERVHDINPECRIDVLPLFAGKETLDTILDNSPDLVIDAIDSLNPKVQTLAVCHQRKIPLISCVGAASRTDPFSIKTGDLFDIQGCPLASRIRKLLRKEGIRRGILCVYSQQKISAAQGSEIDLNEHEYQRGRTRKKLGSLATVTGMFGLAVAHCAIEMLTGGTKTPPSSMMDS